LSSQTSGFSIRVKDPEPEKAVSRKFLSGISRLAAKSFLFSESFLFCKPLRRFITPLRHLTFSIKPFLKRFALRRFITPLRHLTFSIKPFLKRFALRRLITPDRAWGL